MIDFPPFQLDMRAGQLRRDARAVPLRPKTFAVLQYLADRPGALVTKQSLLDAVWTDVTVSEDVVRLLVVLASACDLGRRADPADQIRIRHEPVSPIDVQNDTVARRPGEVVAHDVRIA